MDRKERLHTLCVCPCAESVPIMSLLLSDPFPSLSRNCISTSPLSPGFLQRFNQSEGNGNPLQYSCLENPVDRGAWWAAVQRVAQSRTRLKRLGRSSSSQREALTRDPRARGETSGKQGEAGAALPARLCLLQGTQQWLRLPYNSIFHHEPATALTP